MRPAKCNYSRRALTFAQREAGCPLDHCACGTHDVDNKEHDCEVDDDVHEIDRRSGWDSSP